MRALGSKLVSELGLDSSVDTLGRWMSHYVAELMSAPPSASSVEKQDTETRCYEAILRLWQHRSELPDGSRPFRDLEPILRAIESLDPQSVAHRYFADAQDAAVEREECGTADDWLKLAAQLDATAREFIGFALGQAAGAAVDKSKPWVETAQAAGMDLGAHSIVIEYLSKVSRFDKAGDVDQQARGELERRITQLQAFVDMAEVVLKELRSHYDAFQSVKAGEDAGKAGGEAPTSVEVVQPSELAPNEVEAPSGEH